MSKYDDYEMTIGIECHVQLSTKTKLFSAADNDSRFSEPNQNVTLIDYGLPGTLPVLNKEAVTLAIKAAKALNAKVAKYSSFDRKHYFYPDLPKGYQTTQMFNPTILEGYIDAPLTDGSSVRVRINHAHIEEDAGKLTHYSDHSLVDLNRAGTPLIEIVSEPDMHSAEEARAYASELHKLMVYSGVTHGDLYHGNMRFDVNISVAKKGSDKLGTRAEIKNLNSFRSVEKAAEYEFKRQIDLIESGEKVVQETRGWHDDKQITTSQRSKEDSHDYRYMPDPDIPPIVLTDEYIEEIQQNTPMLPSEYRKIWEKLDLDKSVINTVLNHQSIAVTLEAIYSVNDETKSDLCKEYGLKDSDYDKLVCRIFNLFASTPVDDIDIDKVESGFVGPRRLLELAKLAEKNEISSNSAKEIFLFLFDEDSTGKFPEDIAKERQLLQVSDEGFIDNLVDEVIKEPASQKAIDDIKNGNNKAIGYLVGQVMKRSKGKANPSVASKIIMQKIK